MRISIEGNIGSGKSTQIKRLNYPFTLEPIEEWDEYLKLFYKDPKRWAFTFQMKVLLSQMYYIPDDNEVLLTERSPVTAKDVFMKNIYNNGDISELEYQLYCDFYHAKFDWKPEHTIYIRVPAEICRERALKRGDDIPLIYLQQLEKLHDHVFKRAIIIDGNKDIEEITEIINNKIKNILKN